MLADGRTYRLKFFARWSKVATKMPAAQTPEEICEPIEEEQPSEEKMPAPSHGQIAMAWQSGPPRKASLLISLHGIPAETQHAGRVEIPAKHGGDALRAVLGPHGLHSNERVVELRCLTEIESRMGVEYLQAAH